MKVRKFRTLRMKHGIQLEELGEKAGLSKQRVSKLELDEVPVTQPLKGKIEMAFVAVMAERLRNLSSLEIDYIDNRDSLFDFVEDGDEL